MDDKTAQDIIENYNSTINISEEELLKTIKNLKNQFKGNKKKILSLKAKNKEIKFFIRYAQGSLTSLKEQKKLEEAKNGKSNKF